MNLKIKAVQTNPKGLLRVSFVNGEIRLFDLRPYLDKGVFRELKKNAYLKKVRIISGGIEWPHHQDLSADTLYYRSKPLNQK